MVCDWDEQFGTAAIDMILREEECTKVCAWLNQCWKSVELE